MAADSIRKVRFDDVQGLHLLVALSGGADSVALLKLLWDRRAACGLTLTAAHFHHGIRAEAEADLAFCRELCARLDVPLIEGRGDVPLHARQTGTGLETAARELRYAFLRSACVQANADRIALAHHLDDQAETILMHLFRGAGSRGVGGMARNSGLLYRPLLGIPKADLVQFLEEAGIGWQEDATNAVCDNPRNALRLNVLPEIEKSYPMASSAIARHGEIAREEDEFLHRLTGAFLAERLQTGPYGQRLLLSGGEETVLLRRAVRKITGEDLDAEKTGTILALAARPKGRLEISGSLMLERTPSALYFLPKQKEKPVPVPLLIPGETVLPGICRIVAECGNFPIEPDNPLTECFDPESLQGAVLRLRQNGDRIHPLGAPGERLLSDYLTDKKLDRPLREFLPLVAVGRQVIWAAGLGIAHAARIHEINGRMVRLSIISITDEQVEVLK